MLICFLVALPVAFAALEIVREAQSITVWINDARHSGVAMPRTFNDIPWAGGRVAAWWQDNLSSPFEANRFFRQIGPGSILGITRNLGPEILHRALLFAITLITVFFLFRDGETLWIRFMDLGGRIFGARSASIASHVIDAVHGTVDGLVLVGLVEGVVISVGYWVTDVPHKAAFAIATCILATIPFGAPLMFCLAALLILAQGSALAGIGLIVFGFIVVFVTDHIIRPIVIGGATQVPFLLVLLGIFGGLSSLGLVGLFVGPALMAVIVAVWRDLSVDMKALESD
jgi:predicted PurR-regulated permease PerM